MHRLVFHGLRRSSSCPSGARVRSGGPTRYLVVALLLLGASPGVSWAQTVTGRVTDAATGQPLFGASVAVAGAEEAAGRAVGTITARDGSYTIDVPSALNTLTFSHIGYRRAEIEIGGRARVDAELEVQAVALDELIVVGYGTQQRIHLTGAVSAVTTDELETRPVGSVTNALQGLMPGVTIRSHTGLPGQGAGNIRIRGISTWGNANPLVVIDGIPGGNLSILNPDDIESISVLKDAAAASIYGVRGSNGVIVVSTRRGAPGTAPRLTYTNYFGVQRPTALPELTSSVDYMELLNEAMENAFQSPRFSAEEIEIARSGADPNFYGNTDWISEVYRNSAPQQNHSLSIRGGAENINYLASYGYLNEGGLVVGDNFNADRHNLRLRVGTTIRDRLDVDANLGYVDREYTAASAGVGAACCGPLYRALQISPLVPVHFTSGSWATAANLPNPVALATDGGTNAFHSQEFTGNVNASLSLFEGFHVRGQFGQIRSNSKRDIFARTIDYYHPESGVLMSSDNAPNSFESRDYGSVYNTLMGLAEYDREFGGRHRVSAMVGASSESTVGEQFNASRRNLPTQDIGSINLGSENFQNSGSATQNALQSAFGRVGYGLHDRYLAEVTFRYDGSSRFHPDVRWNLFTAGSLGWVFSEESFFGGLRDVIESGKVRLSYGTQGNDRVLGSNDFPYMSLLNPVQSGAMVPIGNQPVVGFRHTVAANPNITWETAVKRNVGVDLLALRGRLGITAEYFLNETHDLLLNPPIPSVFGFGTSHPPQNAGTVENRGWELEASWRDAISDLRYGLRFNLSDVRNRVTDLGGIEPAYGNQVRHLDHPLDSFYGYVVDGIAQVDDFTYDEATGRYLPNFPVMTGDPVAPGDLRYRDLDGDGVITPDDREVIGSPIPRFTYGFRGDLGWRGLDLSFFLQGVGKADGFIQGAGRHAFVNVSSPIPQTAHLDRWTPDNPDASYPRLTHLLEHNTRLSTFWLEDASYLRLKNVQLGYTLPASVSERLGSDRLRLYASGENLFTSTDFYYAFDPETPVSSGGFYPQVRTFVVGVQADF